MITKDQVRLAQERAAEMLAQAGISIILRNARISKWPNSGWANWKRPASNWWCISTASATVPRNWCFSEADLPGASSSGPGRRSRQDGNLPLPQGASLVIRGGGAQPGQAWPPARGERSILYRLSRDHLHPGEQFTIPSDTLHWFQAGDEGAIVSDSPAPAMMRATCSPTRASVGCRRSSERKKETSRRFVEMT